MSKIKSSYVLNTHRDLFKEVGKYYIPVWAITTLIYGDGSGLEDGEEEMILGWLEEEFKEKGWKHITFDFEESDELREFNSSPPFGLPCDCVPATVWGHKG